ncbi:hypothetical protein C2S53_003032 [Perilla frutescens var. hirtella]|uniref:DUF4378 domain-containing protein n=1 Tax=Perilla frutescens var. hirtella TaxID=608512 RepID=A0AAD4JL46_PERFH|nr:hypothetical protein C2S53_003032 [Perilla frutescens var. hirtella]
MGKEWLYWVGGGGGGNSRSSSTKRGRAPPGEMKKAAASASAGCMCAVFHLFHWHHFQFPSTHRNQSNTHPNTLYPFLHEEATTTSTGLEAPRNSLKLEETAVMKLEQNLNFPAVGIEIKTSSPRISKSRLDDISSDCNSPGTKTPGVVARLMGLDLLPQIQCTSPLISSKSHRSFFDYDIAAGTRSLPETPRISSSRRSDVEGHRLSLQINKENIINEEVARLFISKQDESSRRSVGLDITNRNTDHRYGRRRRRDENLVLMKHDNPADHSQQNSNARFLDHNINKIKLSPNTLTKSSRISSSSSSYDRHQIPLKQERHGHHYHSKQVSRRRERERNKFNLSERASSPLSRDKILNTNIGPTLLQVKKLKCPSPPPTILPQKQPQVSPSDALSSKSSTRLSCKPSHQSYNKLQLQRNKILTPPPPTASPCSTNGGATALHGGAPPEHRNYVKIILKHAGIINRVNPLTKWHTPSHPMDPGIFHHLELKAAVAAAVLSQRCNRKLIFELVDELLAETLTTPFNLRQRISPVGCFPLVEELCKKIESFPAAKCVVLEDIDSLIDRDMCKSQSNGYLGEEEEMMVCEIEAEIVEWLVCEAVAVMGGDAAEETTKTLI